MEGLEQWRNQKKYTVLEAVLLFLGKKPEIGLSNIQCSRHPELKYKYIPIRKIFIEAIESSQLPAELKNLGGLAQAKHFYEGGANFVLEESFVSRKDIKAWLRDDKIPSEFFEESGQPGHLDLKHEGHVPRLDTSVLSEDDNLKLEAEIGDLKKQIEEVKKANKTLKSLLASLIDKVADAGPDKLKTLERRSYLNMIAVLLKYISGKFPDVERHPSYKKESILINDIVYKYFEGDENKYLGLSLRNLSKRFGQARKLFESEDSRIRTR